MKARLVTVRKVKHPRYKFRATFSQGGEYQAKWFKSKTDAENFAEIKEAELANIGIAERGVTPEEYRAVLHSRKIAVGLQAAGIAEPFTVTRAVDYLAEHIRRTRASRTVKKALEDFLDTKEREGIGALHTKTLRLRLAKFAEKFASRTVSLVEESDVSRWLYALKCEPRTRENYRLVLGNFFEHCRRRKWTESNPAKAIKIKVRDKPPGILSPSDTRALLEAAAPEIVPALAIGFFAGLRDSEIARLDWNEVNFARGFIEVKALKTKTAQRRLVTITANLAAWLEPYRKEAGAVRPSEWIMISRRADAREAAGITEWPHNACRHSFASYHLAAGEDAAKTALQLGHSDTKILFKDYRELVAPSEAVEYFAITPQESGKAKNVVKFRRAS